jgi:5S rRNA maturation endonuclease (ribonuclease M5)
MRDGDENMVGIRLRSANGDKWAVKGSHSGCFIPMARPDNLVLVVEGPTDTAAGLDLGFYTVGRPSCSGGGPQLKRLFQRLHTRRVAIIADNDEPGIRGAQTLCDVLPIPSTIVVLPCKDLRQFKALGGTKEMLNSRIEQSIWRNV